MKCTKKAGSWSGQQAHATENYYDARSGGNQEDDSGPTLWPAQQPVEHEHEIYEWVPEEGQWPSQPAAPQQNPTTHKPHITAKKNRSCSLWIWETCACFVAIIALSAILATLYPHAGNPLPQWPFQISINALLFVYSLVLKAALLFVTGACLGQLQWAWFTSDHPLHDLVWYDQAGRGSWGSVRFIWLQRMRHPLAAFGALITVIAVAIDPFIQQLVAPEDCSVTVIGQNATMPRTNYFDPDEPVAIAGVLTSGVLSPGTTIASQCSTGNCTFTSTYETLAYCSYCDDTTATVETTTTCSNNAKVGSYTGVDSPYNICPPNSSINITSTTSTGLTSTFFVANTSYPASNVNNTAVLIMEPTVYTGGDYTINQDFFISFLWGKVIYNNQPGEGCVAGKDTWACNGYGAVNCTLKPCVREYNATIVGNIIEEVQIAQSQPMWHDVTPDIYDVQILDTECTSADDNVFLKTQGFDVEQSQERWMLINGLDPEGSSRNSSLSRSLLDRKCLYMAGVDFGQTLPQMVQQLFADKIIFNGRTDTALPIMQHIYDDGRVGFDHIQQIFANVSDAMTQYIRMNGAANWSDPATGQVNHYATCIKVRWPWLAFPAALTALTIIYFVVVVASSSLQQMPLWKASILAWIFRTPSSLRMGGGLGPEPSVRTTAEMDDWAKNIVVRLVDESGPCVELVDLRERQPWVQKSTMSS
jgi:hypothetical protein